MTTLSNGDLTLREAERILTAQSEQYAAHLREHALLAEAHKEKHEAEQKAVDKAEATISKAVDTALEALDTNRDTHDQAHQREHSMSSEALVKAESSMDKRLESVAKLLEERDKAWGVRFEDTLRAITNIEKLDVKAEGKSLGQGTVIAIIVTAISVVGTILGIIIVLSNLVTGA